VVWQLYISIVINVMVVVVVVVVVIVIVITVVVVIIIIIIIPTLLLLLFILLHSSAAILVMCSPVFFLHSLPVLADVRQFFIYSNLSAFLPHLYFPSIPQLSSGLLP